MAASGTSVFRAKVVPMAPKSNPFDSALVSLRRLATALPGAEEYVMVHHPAFRVGKKPFAIVGMDEAATLSINLGPEAQADLLSDARFTRTHYIGQHGWVTVDYDALKAGEVASLIEGSWQRIAGKKHLAAHAAGHAPALGGAALPVTQSKASAAGTTRALKEKASTSQATTGAKSVKSTTKGRAAAKGNGTRPGKASKKAASKGTRKR